MAEIFQIWSTVAGYDELHACDFSQSETEKYYDWKTIFFTSLWKKEKTTSIQKMENHFALQHQLQEFLY